MSTVTAVTLTRRRHPFEGRSLQVLGSMRRHGAAELLVVLPDGSKRLIPAAWTDLEQPAAVRRATLRRLWDRFRTCCSCLCWFRVFPPGPRTAGSRLHGSHRARRTTVQPVQLSLLPDSSGATPGLIGQLPGPQVDAAVTLLAGLIARAAADAAARRRRPAMSEPGKITASHRSRAAVIYVRQSTLAQLERNTESTARQYDLVTAPGSWAGRARRSGSSTPTWASPGR